VDARTEELDLKSGLKNRTGGRWKRREGGGLEKILDLGREREKKTGRRSAWGFRGGEVCQPGLRRFRTGKGTTASEKVIQKESRGTLLFVEESPRNSKGEVRSVEERGKEQEQEEE